MRAVLGALLGLGVALLCLIPPIVHFVTGPLSPLIGGLVGAGALRVPPGQAVVMGVLLGLLLSVPVGVAYALTYPFPNLLPDGARGVLLLVGVGLALYGASLGTVGALLGSRRAMR